MKQWLVVLFLLCLPVSLFALRGDIDNSGRVDGLDLIILSQAFGSNKEMGVYNRYADLDASGKVDGNDLTILAINFGRNTRFERYSSRTRYVPGQVIVKFYADITSSNRQDVLKQHGTHVLEDHPKLGVTLVSVPAYMNEMELIVELEQDPNVEYAELNQLYFARYVPNDPYYPFQWHFAQIGMEFAWDISRGGNSNVTVAVLDTGVAYENYGSYRLAPDLAATNFIAPYNFYEGTAHANDDDGHGTHVTGTIAQNTNNNQGVAGIAFAANIMPVKVLGGPEGAGTVLDVAHGIEWAVDNGAQVINMSLGGPDYSSTLDNACQEAHNRGVIIVAATGNDADDPDWNPNSNGIDYPAGYDNVIAVGAVRYDETRAYYSNYGQGIDLVAPGGDLNVDQNLDGYGDGVLQETFGNQPDDFGYYFFQGTSMATPHVAGTCALIVSLGVSEPELVYSLLTTTAKDLGATGYDTEYGHGLLNAYEAVMQATGGMGWAN